jgi:hypothetical protein
MRWCKAWRGVGEVGAEDGSDRGPEEAHLATCRHGRGLDGSLASAEGSADGCGPTHIAHGPAPGSRGSQGGGGHTRHTGTCPTQPIAGPGHLHHIGRPGELDGTALASMASISIRVSTSIPEHAVCLSAAVPSVPTATAHASVSGGRAKGARGL